MSEWCKNESRLQAEYEHSSGADHSAKQIRQTQHPEVTEMLDLWISTAMAHGILLTREILHQKWRVFADLAGVPADERLNLSNGWLDWYKTQNGLKEFKRHGKAASAASETIAKERQRLQELIEKYGYRLWDIFNMDETSMFYAYVHKSFVSILNHFKFTKSTRLPPDHGLSNKQQSGVKGNKICITYVFTANADSLTKLDPLVIGRAHKPHAFNGKTGLQLGFNYRNNAKAWMTASIYQEWLSEWDRKL